jgi:hypothetical protein
MCGWDSSTVTATRYCLNGPGFEPRWGGGGRFSRPIQKTPMSTLHFVKWVPDIFPRGKAAGA